MLFPSLDDETGRVLARILSIPSVHLPTVIPTTVTPITSAPGKKDRKRSGKALPSAKENRGKLASSSPDDLIKQEEEKVREETLSNPKKRTKIQMCELL